MDKSILYLQDIERCKALEPIMREAGIEADLTFEINDDGKIIGRSPGNMADRLYDSTRLHGGYVPTYRKDSIELLFPDWVWGFGTSCIFLSDAIEVLNHDFGICTESEELEEQITALASLMFFNQDRQESLNAAADLAILLHQNGLKREVR